MINTILTIIEIGSFTAAGIGAVYAVYLIIRSHIEGKRAEKEFDEFYEAFEKEE